MAGYSTGTCSSGLAQRLFSINGVESRKQYRQGEQFLFAGGGGIVAA